MYLKQGETATIQQMLTAMAEQRRILEMIETELIQARDLFGADYIIEVDEVPLFEAGWSAQCAEHINLLNLVTRS